MINADNLIMFIIISGFALCSAYFLAQYRDWRRRRMVDAEEMLRVRRLFQADYESSHQQESVGARGVDLANGSFIGSSAPHTLTDAEATTAPTASRIHSAVAIATGKLS